MMSLVQSARLNGSLHNAAFRKKLALRMQEQAAAYRGRRALTPNVM